MDRLELLAPDDEGAIRIYIQLGRALEREIERLEKLGLTARLAEVRKSFTEFLDALNLRKEGMPAGALIWIAETNSGLAKGLKDEQGLAAGYFNTAADTYQEIINNADSLLPAIQHSSLMVMVAAVLVYSIALGTLSVAWMLLLRNYQGDRFSLGARTIDKSLGQSYRSLLGLVLTQRKNPMASN